MIINKNFDNFKSIIESSEQRQKLLSGANWWERSQLWILDNSQIVIENNRVMIELKLPGKQGGHYAAEFIRNQETNEILIQNSKVGKIWFYFANRVIRNRIIQNWGKSKM